MTAEELMHAIAARAKFWADQPLDHLRMQCGTANTPQGAIRENRWRRRGDLLEEILWDEFEGAAKKIDEEEG